MSCATFAPASLRAFITLLGGAMAPLVARAQQGERMRRIRPLIGVAYDPGRPGPRDLAARRV